MSVLSTIKVDVEKYFKATGSDLEKFAVAFQSIFGKVPSALQTVENFIGELAPIVTAAVALADPAVESLVAGALATVETGLGAIQAAATSAVTGTSLVSQLQNFAGTVPALLKGLDIKNPALTATITKIVNLVTGEAKVLIPAVESWVAELSATSAALTPVIKIPAPVAVS
jgi:hypothetical protein